MWPVRAKTPTSGAGQEEAGYTWRQSPGPLERASVSAHPAGMLASYPNPSHGAGRPLAICCPPPSGAMGQVGSLPSLMGLSL